MATKENIDITDSSVVTPSVTVTEPMSVEPTQEEPPVHRVSSKQRRLSLEEYRSVYLPVPKIENRMPVFISARLRDELELVLPYWYQQSSALCLAVSESAVPASLLVWYISCLYTKNVPLGTLFLWEAGGICRCKDRHFSFN